MSRVEEFKKHIEEGYTFKGDSIVLGGAVLGETPVQSTLIKAPLKMLNRHGLIAGATGTGKTKTIQVIAEALSDASVPVLVMDLKGDLSGLAASGKDHPKIQERHGHIGIPYEPRTFPVELLTLSNEKGARLRATVSEFGPVLFSKILNLNDTQSGIVSVVFKYCDDKQLALLDLKDFKKTLNFITNDGKKEIEEVYGKISAVSVGTILRKVIELEQQGADMFFGETSFDVEDLVRIDENGNGVTSIIRLTDIQDRPKLFSTFMLCLLAEIYSTFPEAGDLDRPKLVLFIDEAHLIFNQASRALLDQIESIIKLIRSKGVGIFFCTQNPTDIPDAVLSQLGMKVQHALRAFTAKDRKMIRLTAENYPLTDYYDTETMLTSLGIGEAAITVLGSKGRPTPLAHTLLRAPRSRMDILEDSEIDDLLKSSKLIKKYNKEVDRESAYEILGKKIKAAQEEAKQAEIKEQNEKVEKGGSRKRSSKKEPGVLESISKNTRVRQMGRTIVREISRSILGILGVKKR